MVKNLRFWPQDAELLQVNELRLHLFQEVLHIRSDRGRDLQGRIGERSEKLGQPEDVVLMLPDILAVDGFPGGFSR